MRARPGVLVPLLAASILPTLAGCGPGAVARQAFYELRGAQTEVMLISKFPEDTLTRYRHLICAPATSTAGDKLCPPRLLRDYDTYLGELADNLRDVYPGDEPGLRIASEILYFQPKGLLGGALCLVRVRMHDATDEHLVVDAMVLTESKSFREGSRRDLAESSVKGLSKFLREQEAPAEELFDDL